MVAVSVKKKMTVLSGTSYTATNNPKNQTDTNNATTTQLPRGVIVHYYALSLTPNVFFFFQAEDGIRAHCVTGVQTCPLPIFASKVASSSGWPDSTTWISARPSLV